MIAASGLRFDGLDLVAFIAFLVALYFLAYWWLLTYWHYRVEQVTGYGTVTMAVAEEAFRSDYLPVMQRKMEHTPIFFALLTDEQVYGEFSETPVSFYDWANERPVPVVNW